MFGLIFDDLSTIIYLEIFWLFYSLCYEVYFNGCQCDEWCPHIIWKFNDYWVNNSLFN